MLRPYACGGGDRTHPARTATALGHVLLCRNRESAGRCTFVSEKLSKQTHCPDFCLQSAPDV